MLALKVLPEGKKKKLRGSVNISIGNMIAELLEFSCHRLDKKDINENDSNIVSKQLVLFKEF